MDFTRLYMQNSTPWKYRHENLEQCDPLLAWQDLQTNSWVDFGKVSAVAILEMKQNIL